MAYQALEAASFGPSARYHLDRLLGLGATSEVWKAIPAHMQGPVAIKVLRAQSPAGALGPVLIEHERQALRRVRHPGVVRLLHGARHQGWPYLVLQHLEGETLTARLARGPLAPAAVVALARQLAATLQAVHRAGVLHLDLHPRNVMMTGENGSSRAVLFDFGDACARPDPTERLYAVWTRPGERAPELLRGLPVDPRTDLWGLGTLLLSAAGGTTERLTPALRALIPRLCAADPAERPVSAAMVADLLGTSGEPR